MASYPQNISASANYYRIPYIAPYSPTATVPQKRSSEDASSQYRDPDRTQSQPQTQASRSAVASSSSSTAQASPSTAASTQAGPSSTSQLNITFKPVTFDDSHQPSAPKRKRLQALKMSPEELKAEQQRLIALRKEKEAAEAPQREEEKKQREAQLAVEKDKEREVLMQQKTQRVLACIKSEGLTLDRLWMELLNAKDSHTTALVTRVLNAHGTAIADAMAARRPKVFEGWVKSRVGRVYGGEAKKLRGRLKEGQKKAVKAAVGHLAQWKVLEEIARCAPVLLEAVEALRGTEEGDGVENAKEAPLSSGLGSSKES